MVMMGAGMAWISGSCAAGFGVAATAGAGRDRPVPPRGPGAKTGLTPDDRVATGASMTGGPMGWLETKPEARTTWAWIGAAAARRPAMEMRLARINDDLESSWRL